MIRSIVFALAVFWCTIGPGWGEELDTDLRVSSMQRGIWLVEADSDWNGNTISANGLILTSEDEVLVVDTPWTDEQTGRLLDWVDSELGLPVRYLVVTHAHNDRIGGIGEAHRRGIETYGYDGTAELAVNQDLEPPQRTFSESLHLQVGDETVTLLYPGPGHAPDNIVVWFDDRQLLYGGCFIKNLASRSLGYTGDADLEAWPQSLSRLQEWVAAPVIVIPGHGEVGGPELLERTRILLHETSTE